MWKRLHQCRHLGHIPKLLGILSNGRCKLAKDIAGWENGPYTIRLRNGITMELRPQTSDWWIFLEVFVFEQYAPCYERLRQSAWVVDIGANVGFFSLMASAINPTLSIAAFEPFPGNYEQLCRNIRSNPGTNITAHPQAIADHSGETLIHYTPGDESGCSLFQPKTHTSAVTTLGIQELYDLYPGVNIDVLKMDCEGAEYSIVKSMSSKLMKQTKSIIMEYHNEEEMLEMSDILSSNGFACSRLLPHHMLYAVAIR